MKNKIETQSAIVHIGQSKNYDFLYTIKNVNTGAWLPKIAKSAVKDAIQSTGLHSILYRIYTNQDGYEAIYICKASKIVTE